MSVAKVNNQPIQPRKDEPLRVWGQRKTKWAYSLTSECL
jgi:hypothetical protein